MRNPLIIAVAAALAGFGGWVWLTGPGTSVPNALMALLCAAASGRAAWALVARNLPDEDAVAPPPTGRRAPPPADPAPWRAPQGREARGAPGLSEPPS